LDEQGNVAWSTPARKDHAAWRGGSFATGDLTGDGLPEWVFRDVDQTLAVVLTTGEKLGEVVPAASLEGFCVVSRPDRASLLVTLVSERIEAFALERATETAENQW